MPIAASWLGPPATAELLEARPWLPRRLAGWLSPAEAARELGVTARTIRNWCDRGRLHCEVLVSGHRRIPARAFDLFLAGEPYAEQAAPVKTREQKAAEFEAKIRADVEEAILQRARARGWP